MAKNDPAPNEPNNDEDFKPITTQEELDKVLGKRIYEERAKYVDFDKFKADSEALAQIKAENQTELEREKERAEALAKEVAAYKAAESIAGWKRDAAEAFGVTAELLRGSTKDEITQHAEELAKHLSSSPAPHIPSDGRKPSAAGKSTDEQFAEVFGAMFK